MDPLSSLLTHLKPHTHRAGRFDLGANQSVEFPIYKGIKCYVVVAGRCWLTVADCSQTAMLETGDCFLLAGGQRFQLESEPGSPALSMCDLIAAMEKGLPGLYEGEPACTLAGGHFTFQGVPIDLLSELLPNLIVLPKSARSAAMRMTLERMRDELMMDQPGGAFLVEQLSYLMLVDAIRAHLERATPSAVGWFYAMSDEQLQPTLKAMHDAPSQDWTLETLARHAGMSRALFARRFKERVGESPIDYLTRWRMLRASEQLSGSKLPVIEIAQSFGYESESSFGKAYKRVTGLSPRQYRFGRSGEDVSLMM